MIKNCDKSSSKKNLSPFDKISVFLFLFISNKEKTIFFIANSSSNHKKISPASWFKSEEY